MVDDGDPIPSLEMEWHDHLPRLAQEAGLLDAYMSALEAVGEFMPDEDDQGRFTPMAYTHLEYINKVHAKLKSMVSAGDYERYMALYEKEPSVFAARDMVELLTQRFGEGGNARFWNAFHDQSDHRARFSGSQRLMDSILCESPFWYHWFESDDRPYHYHDYGFSYLDKAIAWAERHDLYVMLDFHGAPGGQSPWDHTGALSEIGFFTSPETSDAQPPCGKRLLKGIVTSPLSGPMIYSMNHSVRAIRKSGLGPTTPFTMPFEKWTLKPSLSWKMAISLSSNLGLRMGFSPNPRSCNGSK